MKKYFYTIGVIVICLLTLLTPKATAGEYYWGDFIETAKIEYNTNRGEIDYKVKILEYNNGEPVEDGFDNEITLNYGVFKDTEVKLDLYTYGKILDYQNGNHYIWTVGEIKHNFIDNERTVLSGKGRIYSKKERFEDSYTTPRYKLLFDKVIDEKVVLHNNFWFQFHDSGEIGKKLINGITYNVNSENMLKFAVETYSDGDHYSYTSLKTAYKTVLNDKMNYISYFRKNVDSDNLHLSNVLQFKYDSDLNFSVNLKLNSNNNEWIIFKGNRKLTEDYTAVAEYQREMANKGYNCLKVGLNYKFE